MDCPITITSTAIQKLKDFLSASPTNKYVVVGVKGGGCAGLKFVIDLAEEKKHWHFLFEIDGVSIIIDPVSASYLKGTTIDWKEGMMGAGFSFSNPEAKATCGCGSSFST